MSNLYPIILELDDELSEQEEMIDIRTIHIQDGRTSMLGYLAVIKDFSGVNKLRYGNLKARVFKGKKINNFVL